jgi:hypothetical protein
VTVPPLRLYRASKGLTRPQLAAQLGVCLKSLYTWETGGAGTWTADMTRALFLGLEPYPTGPHAAAWWRGDLCRALGAFVSQREAAAYLGVHHTCWSKIELEQSAFTTPTRYACAYVLAWAEGRVRS